MAFKVWLGIALLVGVLYAAENWQGKRAWRALKSQLIAEGQRLDPKAFVPPPVPDEENFAKAPSVRPWLEDNSGRPVVSIPMLRPPDQRRVGLWSVARPTDLKEWRDCFRPPKYFPVAEPTNGVTTPPREPGFCPLIVLDDVPIAAAIRGLARQAGLEVLFDPRALDPSNVSVPPGNANVTVRFENVTVSNALEAVLDNYGLALVRNPRTGTVRVVGALAALPLWPQEPVELEPGSISTETNELTPLIQVDDVPALDAIKNLCRLAGINFQLDPALASRPPLPNVTLRMTNATPQQCLMSVFDKLELAFQRMPGSSVFRIVPWPAALHPSGDYSAEDLLTSFRSFEEELQALHAACERTKARCDVDYRLSPWGWRSVGYRPGFHVLPPALSWHASAQLALGRSEAAMRDWVLMSRLAESLEASPDANSVWRRAETLRVSLQIVWEGLASRRWSAAQMRFLERELGRVDLLDHMGVCLEAEQALVNTWFEETPAATLASQVAPYYGPQPFFGYRGSVPGMLRRAMGRNCPSGWVSQNQLCFTRAMRAQQQLLGPHRIHPERYPDTVLALQETRASFLPSTFLTSRVGADLTWIFQQAAGAQAGVDQARIACAVELYRLDHGTLPDTLEQLSPRYLASVPKDICTGEDLHFRHTHDGQYVIYSVGWNLKNEWGRPGHTDGDWVWRYPAK